LTVYTDYTLRVMMYLAVKHKTGELATIDNVVDAYQISRAHIAKIVYDLALAEMVITVRGRTGGIRLARPPEEISIGDLVRLAEKDFAVVACHDESVEVSCAVFPACNLKRGFRRAVDAFMMELDRISLADSISSHSVAAGALGIHGTSVVSMPVSRRKASDASPPLPARASTKGPPAARKSASTKARKT
jgi:Rrf2 family transcriptional regulator, nitric oxide-sensitive transcriptional repressor